MSNRHNKITDALCKTLLTLKSIDKYRAFLKDACTINEILDISQTLTVAELLSNGASYPVISKETGASTAAINRVGKCCEYGSGGCKTVINR